MLQMPYLWDLKGYWDTGLILSEGPPLFYTTLLFTILA